MNRTLKAAALTAAISAAALVSSPVTAFADQSHGRPVGLHVTDRGHDDRRGTDENHRGIDDRGTDVNHRIIDDRGIIADRGRVTENRGGVTEDRRDYRRRDRSIVLEVSQSAGPLLLRSHSPVGDWPGALRVGSSVVRVRSNDNADYRALRSSGSVQIVVRNGRTLCDAQGRLRCAVEGPSVVRVFRV